MSKHIRSTDQERELFFDSSSEDLNSLLKDLAKSYMTADNNHSAILAKIQERSQDMLAISNLMARRRVMLISDLANDGIQAKERNKIFATQLTNVLPLTIFKEAVKALSEKVPQLATTAAAIRNVYRDRGFAIMKSAELQVTKKVHEILSEALKLGKPRDETIEEVAAQNEKWSRAYSENIFRTNIAHAYSEGQQEQGRTKVAMAVLPAWEYRAVGDSDTRPNHLAAQGLLAAKTDPIWSSLFPPNGFQCLLPGTQLGGLIKSISKARYSGPAVEIKLRNGCRLSVTVNHPILTSSGWRAAKDITCGTKLFCDKFYVDFFNKGKSIVSVPSPSRRTINYNDMPTLVEDAFDSFCSGSTGNRTILSGCLPLDFHGDARFFNGDVHNVVFNSLMNNNRNFEINKRIDDLLFVNSESDIFSLHSLGSSDSFIKGNDSFRTGFPRGTALFDDSISVKFDSLPLDCFGFGSASYMNASVNESFKNSGSGDPEFIRQILEARPGNVTLDDVLEVRHFDFNGHVYSPESEGGWIISDGIYNSNCRCSVMEVDVYELEQKGRITQFGQIRPYYPPTIHSAYRDPGFVSTYSV
jgi:SPP1 gp7 family putative phage head morphogenesis protein